VFLVDQQEATSKDKITLPKNLQREMIKFFLSTSTAKITADKKQQQTPNQNEGC